MARKHWVRDIRLGDVDYTYNGNHTCSNAVLFNFLRNAGWDLLWECDGERGDVLDPNHVPDGDVQTAGTASWFKINGDETLSKDDVFYHSGVRSLKVVAGASGRGVVSDTLPSMTSPTTFRTTTGDTLSGPDGDEMILYDVGRFSDPGIVGSYIDQTEVYPPGPHVGNFLITRWIDENTIRFRNPSGTPKVYLTRSYPPTVGVQDDFIIQPRYEMRLFVATDVALDVEIDRGDGSYYNVGTIPANGGVFTEYHDFWFKRIGSGNSTFRLVAQGAGTFYVGGAHIFRSYWERPSLLVEGVDGIIANPDQFSSVGYTFTTNDVGKRIFIWDPDPGAGRNKNSGCYEIISVLAGVATLDLRSGSAALISATGIKWRMALINTATYPNSSSYLSSFRYIGFGLQSPHASKWRFFIRQYNVGGQTWKGTFHWSAPVDTDFNVSTGHFYKSGPSVMRNRCGDWTTKTTTMHFTQGPYCPAYLTTITRIFTMVAEDGSFFFHTNVHSISNQEHSVFLYGYLGSDLPGIRSFYELCRFGVQTGGSVGQEMYFDDDTKRFGRGGTGFNKTGITEEVGIAQLGYSITSTDDTSVETMTNAGQNPWSSQEWVRPLILCSRDVYQPPSMQMSNCGVFQARANMTFLATFDSHNYLHLQNGLVIEWMGESLV